MEVLILDTTFQTVALMDTFESLIWTDRYMSCGDFEIYTLADDAVLQFLRQDYYVWLKESEHLMIIEELQIKADNENGNHITVTGRSLESILDRRIIWNQTMISGSLQAGIQKLLDENVISPADPARRIPNFIFQPSSHAKLTAMTAEAQFEAGADLYTAIQKLCESFKIGFKIVLNDINQFVFSLYAGEDRSYDQTANPYVVFSPTFDNIINSNYIESKKAMKTVTLIGGEGEAPAQTMASVALPGGSGSGLTRREMYTDASGITSKVCETTLTPAQYEAQLQQAGLDALSENIFVKSFEGQIDTTRTYKFGQDFFMGDIVQLANEYGIESKSRVIEMVRSQSVTGTDFYPTFATLE